MEISSMNSCFGLETRMLAAVAAASPSRTTTRNSRRTLNVVSAKLSSSSSGTSLTSSSSNASSSPLFGGGSITSDFSSHCIRPSLLLSSFSSSPPRRIKRNVITMVIPFVREHPRCDPPPDLASILLSHRIVFLGMSLVPAVTELIIAEFMWLNYESKIRPVYFYINSTGATKGATGQLDFLSEAFAVYDVMGYTKAPVFTLAVGNAWAENALLLAAGAKGNRAALPSASIMLKQPYGMGKGQATSVDSLRKNMTLFKETLVKLYAKHTGKDIDQMENDIRRPKYFSPAEAVEYGIIDKVIHTEKITKNRGVVSDSKKE